MSNVTTQSATDQRFSHPLTNRRRATRQRLGMATQITPWSAGVAPVPFEIVIDDISQTGIGIIHENPLTVGARYLLAVPRADGDKPVVREYHVVRCNKRAKTGYAIGLEWADGTTPSSEIMSTPAPTRVTSPRLQRAFLVFGIIGLLIATFMPM